MSSVFYMFLAMFQYLQTTYFVADTICNTGITQLWYYNKNPFK